jgi:hypothetical protein
MIIEEANENKRQDCELHSRGEIFEKDPTRNIIDFESGREALEKGSFDDGQNRVKLVECSRLHSSLPYDWLEFLLAIMFFVGLLLALVGGLIALWRF